MLQEFINQNYLIIEQNIVTNVTVWNGDTTTWTPPQGSLALTQATIPSKIWIYDASLTPADFVLTEVIGSGDIGFTWDGSVLTTNQEKPPLPTSKFNQPKTSGTITI